MMYKRGCTLHTHGGISRHATNFPSVIIVGSLLRRWLLRLLEVILDDLVIWCYLGAVRCEGISLLCEFPSLLNLPLTRVADSKHDHGLCMVWVCLHCISKILLCIFRLPELVVNPM